jgi:L-threonylcarbamoyladenylate synthase
MALVVTRSAARRSAGYARPSAAAPDMPVPVLVGSWAAVDGLMLGVPDIVRELVEAFWPGGLSLVLTHAPSLAWELGDTRGTVVVRMPLHPFALELLGEVGPMAVSVPIPPATPRPPRSTTPDCS